MAKINNKNIFPKWKTKFGLFALACIGSLILYNTEEEKVQTSPILQNTVFVNPEVNVLTIEDLIDKQSFECLIRNAYYEARNQTEEAIIGVTQVALNRWNDDRYPDDICNVIKQSKYDSFGNIILGQCQFSWYCDGKSDRPKELQTVIRISGIVEKAAVMWYLNMDITNGATHYHANYVKPSWSYKLAYTKQIGDHLFYRWN